MKPKKVCPRCHLEGSGPYPRYVLNTAKKRYEPHWYFAHKSQGKPHWCYLGKNPNPQLSNNRVDNLSAINGTENVEALAPTTRQNSDIGTMSPLPIAQLSNSACVVGDVDAEIRTRQSQFTSLAGQLQRQLSLLTQSLADCVTQSKSHLTVLPSAGLSCLQEPRRFPARRYFH